MTEKTVTVAIQGNVASFHDLAVRNYFKAVPVKIYPCKTFKQVCISVDSGKTDFGIIAIENSLAGSILPNYALLETFPIQIIGEQYLHISHNLMALPGQHITDLRIVRSHPMALAQSSEFFERYPHLEPIETNDTAESAKEISENKLTGVGAVASERAAALFGLEILESGIENLKNNYTRFFIVASKKQNIRIEGQKASLNFRISHQVGSLVEILELFKKYDINLTLIQSVPLSGQPDEYSFHVDLEWIMRDQFDEALQEVKNVAREVYLLGIYKKGEKPY
jgi:prephenate dehydratase